MGEIKVSNSTYCILLLFLSVFSAEVYAQPAGNESERIKIHFFPLSSIHQIPGIRKKHVYGSSRSPQKLKLRIRRPFWAGDGYEITVNGKNVTVDKGPSSYISVNRTWRDGDKIEVELPIELRTEALDGSNKKVAFMYGPILLAGIIGTDVRMPVQYASDQTAFFDLPSVHVPSLKTQNEVIKNWAKPVNGKPLHLKLENVGEAAGITLAPYYKVNHNYYTIYWDVKS